MVQALLQGGVAAVGDNLRLCCLSSIPLHQIGQYCGAKRKDDRVTAAAAAV